MINMKRKQKIENRKQKNNLFPTYLHLFLNIYQQHREDNHLLTVLKSKNHRTLFSGIDFKITLKDFELETF